MNVQELPPVDAGGYEEDDEGEDGEDYGEDDESDEASSSQYRVEVSRLRTRDSAIAESHTTRSDRVGRTPSLEDRARRVRERHVQDPVIRYVDLTDDHEVRRRRRRSGRSSQANIERRVVRRRSHGDSQILTENDAIVVVDSSQ